MEEQLKKFIFAFLLIASFAYADPVGVKTGDDIRKQINSGASELFVTAGKDAVLFIDKRIEMRKSVTIDLRGAIIRERVPNEDAAFYVRSGVLTVVNGGAITDGKSWFAIVDGGEIKLRKFSVTGTRGVFVPRGVLNWIDGDSNTREYGAYLGSVDRSDKHVARFYVESVDFKSTEPTGESPVRIMGGAGQFYDCSFDSSRMTKTAKESVQWRHGIKGESITATKCIARSSASFRPLRKGDGSDAMIAKYHDYARRNPLEVRWVGGSIGGYVQTGGWTTFTAQGVSFAGKDPRGIGGDTCITTEWIGGKQSKAFANLCQFTGWKRKGDSGVEVK